MIFLRYVNMIAILFRAGNMSAVPEMILTIAKPEKSRPRPQQGSGTAVIF